MYLFWLWCIWRSPCCGTLDVWLIPSQVLFQVSLGLLHCISSDSDNIPGGLSCFHLMVSPAYVWVLSGVIKEKNRPWVCDSTVHQQTKHWCVPSAVLVPNPKPSTLQAAVKKITLPAKQMWHSRWKMFLRFCLSVALIVSSYYFCVWIIRDICITCYILHGPSKWI